MSAECFRRRVRGDDFNRIVGICSPSKEKPVVATIPGIILSVFLISHPAGAVEGDSFCATTVFTDNCDFTYGCIVCYEGQCQARKVSFEFPRIKIGNEYEASTLSRDCYKLYQCVLVDPWYTVCADPTECVPTDTLLHTELGMEIVIHMADCP